MYVCPTHECARFWPKWDSEVNRHFSEYHVLLPVYFKPKILFEGFIGTFHTFHLIGHQKCEIDHI